MTWWARRDSNPQPTGYEPAALPLSYGPHMERLLLGSGVVNWGRVDHKQVRGLKCTCFLVVAPGRPGATM